MLKGLKKYKNKITPGTINNDKKQEQQQQQKKKTSSRKFKVKQFGF